MLFVSLEQQLKAAYANKRVADRRQKYIPILRRELQPVASRQNE